MKTPVGSIGLVKSYEMELEYANLDTGSTQMLLVA